MRSAAIPDPDGTPVNSLPDIRAALSRSPARLSPPRGSGEKCRMMIGGGARTPAGRAVCERKDLRRALYGLCRPELKCLSLPGASPEDAVGDSAADAEFAAALSRPSAGCARGAGGRGAGSARPRSRVPRAGESGENDPFTAAAGRLISSYREV